MRFTLVAPVWDGDGDDDGDDEGDGGDSDLGGKWARLTTQDASPSRTTGTSTRQPRTACPSSASSSASSSPATSTCPFCERRDEAEALRADRLARLQRGSVTDADWDNATSSSSSSEDAESEGAESEDGHSPAANYKDASHAALRLTSLQGPGTPAPDMAPYSATAASTSSENAAAPNSAAARQPRPCRPGRQGRRQSRVPEAWRSEPFQAIWHRTSDSWVLLGHGQARPLGPGAPGLTVTRPDGAVFALRPAGTNDVL